MTCRVARSFQNHARVELVYCGKCGSSNLKLSWTSKTLGPHLRSMCVQSNIESGEAGKHDAIIEERLGGGLLLTRL